MRILIIEDDPQLQRGYQRMLKKWFDHAAVETCDNADDAIGWLESRTPDALASKVPGEFDLIISDYDLVGSRTGGDVLDWIRTNRPELLTRFLFISGNEAIRKLHSRCLEKPATTEEIWHAVIG